MEYTRLGRTDQHVSRLAFGTWSFGGDWGPVQLAHGKAAIRKALDLGRFAEQREFPVGQLAIAWTLANPAVDVAIVGARNASQIEQTAPAADIHLGPADLAAIERIMRRAVPVGGPASETV
jgi:aryl-alcohol dehydrogenase-like predicted oxidoreductase